MFGLGLRDYSPFLALLTSLDFWERVGPETIRTYIHGLAHKAGKHILVQLLDILLSFRAIQVLRNTFFQGI